MISSIHQSRFQRMPLSAFLPDYLYEKLQSAIQDKDQFLKKAERNFSLLHLPNPDRFISSAKNLLKHKLKAKDTPAVEVYRRLGITHLRLLGMKWSELSQLIPGVADYYKARTAMNHDEIQRDGALGYDYPVKRPYAVESDSFESSMSIESGHRILDLMTGSGQKVITLAQKYPSAEFTSLEINPDNLLRGSALASALGILRSTLLFVPQDVREPFPVENDSVDRILITGYATFGFDIKLLPALFQKMFQSLRSGGRIWVELHAERASLSRRHLECLVDTAEELKIRLNYLPVDQKFHTIACEVIKPSSRLK